MSDRTGRKIGHGAKSTMDSIIYGRDFDQSGDCPHQTTMSKFEGHAGKPSTEKVVKPFRKPGISAKSTTDTAIWGRDFDQSGTDPHEAFMQSYSDHAGKKAGAAPMIHMKHRPQKRGSFSKKSTADEVIFGRDLDQSGTVPYNSFQEKFAGRAGLPVHNGAPKKPCKKHTFANKAMTDEVVFGIDLDQSGTSPHKEHMAVNCDGRAGLKSDEIVQRPFRKLGISMSDVIDDVVFHRDIDKSGGNPHVELFAKLYGGHAGKKSAPPREVARRMDPRDPNYSKKATPGSATSSPVAKSEPCCTPRTMMNSKSAGEPASVPDVRAAGLASARSYERRRSSSQASLSARPRSNSVGSGGSQQPPAIQSARGGSGEARAGIRRASSERGSIAAVSGTKAAPAPASTPVIIDDRAGKNERRVSGSAASLGRRSTSGSVNSLPKEAPVGQARAGIRRVSSERGSVAAV